jgi:flagellar biosynthesis protein FlhA
MAEGRGTVNLSTGLTLLRNPEVIVALAIIAVLMIMTVPVPPFLLDVLLTMSVTLSVGILLVSIYSERPLDFSVFPTVLLMTTLFRLSLNVATTRAILLHGNEGTSAVGRVIERFGEFVVGGNYVVGLIVFIILVIINFVVITKGSGRVSEVAARFILDAMPGKQMSIDADLNAGLITESEARTRRKQIEVEADFYGSMDGASKFVRGDAIAGIIITAVNIIGGLIVGVFQHNMEITNAARNYTLLTVGDGLVAQIPALIISTASGIIVTRTNTESRLSKNIIHQLFGNPKALGLTGAVLLVLGLVGLPALPFMSLSAVCFYSAYRLNKQQEREEEKKRNALLEPKTATEEEKIENLLAMDLLELEVGYGLISVVDADQDGDLLERVQAIRKQFAQELGIVVPSVHIRDNLQLDPGKYRILIKGVAVAQGDLMPEHLLAMNPGHVDFEIEGRPTKEPVFGLDAVWINKSKKDEASLAGYTVVDLSTVIATHLTETIRKHSHELFGRQELQYILDNLAAKYPKVIEDVIPGLLPSSAVLKILQNLLRERVSVRDMRSILETLATTASLTKDTDILTEQVRAALHRTIMRNLMSESNELYVLTVERDAEDAFIQSLRSTDTGIQFAPDPQLIQAFMESMTKESEKFSSIQALPVVLCSPVLRPHLKRLIDRFVPGIVVISHNEIGIEAKLKPLGSVGLSHAS